jgi:hypothetical protein
MPADYESQVRYQSGQSGQQYQAGQQSGRQAQGGQGFIDRPYEVNEPDASRTFRQGRGGMEASAEEMGRPWPEGSTVGRHAEGPGSGVRGYGPEGSYSDQAQPRGQGQTQVYPGTLSGPADYESQVRYQGGQSGQQHQGGQQPRGGQQGRQAQSGRQGYEYGGAYHTGHERMERPMGERGPMSQSTGDTWHGLDSEEWQRQSGYGGQGGQPRQAGQSRQAGGGREQARQMAGEFQEQGRQMAGRLQEQGREAAGQAMEQGGQILEQARGRAMSMLDERRNQVADSLIGVADALMASGHQLHRQDNHRPAEYLETIAGQVERLSDYVREQDLWSLADQAKSMARRQPELFLGGAFAVGFLVARFLKSSAGSAAQADESSYRTGETRAPGEWSRGRGGQEEQLQAARWQQEQWRQEQRRQAGRGHEAGGAGRDAGRSGS